MSLIARLCAALLLALPGSSYAHDFNLKGIAIAHPYATPTASGAPTGAVYLSLANGTKAPDRLVGASTPRAKSVEMHTMSMAGDIARMREVEAIEVKPGEKLEMRPASGFHLMLVGLNAPLKIGERFALVLRFEKSGTAKVEVVVEEHKPGAAPAHKGHKH
jgi:copper(I)-binding protein